MEVLPTQRWNTEPAHSLGSGSDGRTSRPLLTARHIEVISAVARCGSVTETAELLGVSQPAISMTLRECNELAGFPLFERRRGRMHPTYETSVLIPELDNIIDGLHRVGRILGDLRDANTGHVRLALMPLLADTLLPGAVAAFHRDRTHLTLDTLTTDDPRGEIDRDHADLGLALQLTSSREAGAIEIGQIALVCVMHPDHPLARKAQLCAGDFHGVPLVAFGGTSPMAAIQRDVFESAGIVPAVACQVSNASTALALAEHNVGIAIVPELVLGLAHRSLAVVQFAPATSLAVRLLFPTQRSVSRATRRLSVVLRLSARRVLAPVGTGVAA